MRKEKCRSYFGLEIELPSFRDEIQTETVMRLLASEAKAGGFVDAAR